MKNSPSSLDVDIFVFGTIRVDDGSAQDGCSLKHIPASLASPWHAFFASCWALLCGYVSKSGFGSLQFGVGINARGQSWAPACGVQTPQESAGELSWAALLLEMGVSESNFWSFTGNQRDMLRHIWALNLWCDRIASSMQDLHANFGTGLFPAKIIKCKYLYGLDFRNVLAGKCLIAGHSCFRRRWSLASLTELLK